MNFAFLIYVMSALVNCNPVRNRRNIRNRISKELFQRLCSRETCFKCSMLLSKKQSSSKLSKHESGKGDKLCNYILSRPDCCPIDTGTFMINY